MNFWQFLNVQPAWFKATMIGGVIFLALLIVRKDIKSKWFSAQRRNRRAVGPRKGPTARRKK